MLIQRAKLISITALSALSLALPLSAQAEMSLTVYNYAPVPSTTKVDGGYCSYPFLKQGVTPAAQGDQPGVNSVAPEAIQVACIPSKARNANCEAVVYMSGDCSGDPIAKVTLTIDRSAIQGISSFNRGYSVVQGPATITVNGRAVELAANSIAIVQG